MMETGGRDHDDALLLAAATGDTDAFAAFRLRHTAAVAGRLLRSGGAVDGVAELTAETFAAALLACPRYRPGEAIARDWLLRIAARKVIESRRRGRVVSAARRQLALERIAPARDARGALCEQSALERIAPARDARGAHCEQSALERTAPAPDARGVRSEQSDSEWIAPARGAHSATPALLDPGAAIVHMVAELEDAERRAVSARVFEERGVAEIAAELACSEQTARTHVRRGLARLRERLVAAPA